jgi:hypothetical protein
MLTSRTAELEKRDRLRAKGKDGGSFIPSAIMITGTLDNDVGSRIALPSYINFNNFLSASLIYDGQADATVEAGDWVIDSSDSDNLNIIYNANLNTIDVESVADGQSKKFKLTVFYKG